MAMGMAREERGSQPSSSTSSDASDNGSLGGDPNLDQPRTDEQARLDHDVAMDDFFADWFGDGSHEEQEEIGEHPTPNPRETPDGQRQWKEAEGHARTPIYAGACTLRLAAILALLNLQTRHKASNALLSDIFALLHDLILPRGNVLPGSWTEAKRVLSSIGMEYHIVHACVNDCILYHGEHANATSCPTCEESRYENDMLTLKVP